MHWYKCKEMEVLLNGKGDNNSHRSSSITVFAVIDQATTVTTLQVDGFLTTTSFGNKV
jgi:hypothetical protein